MAQVVIVGGGPGGYEAALVARQAGAEVTLVHDQGLGGSAVLTDVVPSKGLISVGEVLTRIRESRSLGIDAADGVVVDVAAVNQRLLQLAQAQSRDIAERLTAEGVRLLAGRGRITPVGEVAVEDAVLPADVVLIATGARPRALADAQPDAERIFTWEQLYALQQLPQKLVVVGSGVTGAEFASGFRALGAEVVLVSSRDHVLPGEDPAAAELLEQVFRRRGIEVMSRARAIAAKREGDGVVVELADGSQVRGSHCLMAVGSVPNTADLGLAEAGIVVDDRGFIAVDRVSRTSRNGIYAAGDCTGVLMLASTAAMQGRIAMHHALGTAVSPLDLDLVSANVFTDPEIATVGVSQQSVTDGLVEADVVMLPLATNPRAKMQQLEDGFVKLFCQPTTRTVLGGVIVAPNASELIYAVAVAVKAKLTVADLAGSFTIYPSLSGSVAEAARRLRRD